MIIEMAPRTRPVADTQWAAVAARDRSADGQFVYAVTSTGIYCRPSCPSRRPRPDRVRFYPTPDGAEAAGFRACNRCRPRDARTSTEQAVDRARAWIDTHPDARPSLDRLARVTGVSPWHLQRIFTKAVGVSPRDYARARRTAALRRELRRSSVTEAIYAAGFGSASRVYEDAPGDLGMTPGIYRRGGRGERIVFATRRTAIGVVLAAATTRGLCRVALGDDAGELERALRQEFPDADIARNPGAMRAAMQALTRVVNGQPLGGSLPVDVAATAFQRRVWRALQAIPAGETRTYGEVASAIGRPSATRAVARACATNPLALVVPCHRVVPSSGGPAATGGAAKERRNCSGGRPRSRPASPAISSSS